MAEEKKWKSSWDQAIVVDGKYHIWKKEKNEVDSNGEAKKRSEGQIKGRKGMRF